MNDDRPCGYCANGPCAEHRTCDVCGQVGLHKTLCVPSTAPSPLFFVACRRPANDGSVLWWRPDSRGYTTNLDDAGQYGEAEARSIERIRGQEVAVPVNVARRVSHQLRIVFPSDLPDLL